MQRIAENSPRTLQS